MSFALFEGDERLTRSFPTEEEVWAAAERAGLVDVDADGKKRLEDHLEVRPCDASPDERTEPEAPDSDLVFSRRTSAAG
jgi:hypothetical protein